MRRHPTPWKLDPPTATHPYIIDAKGDVACCGLAAPPRATSRRIVRAVNAYESPTAKAERAVVKAAIAWYSAEGYYAAANSEGPLSEACERLLAARKKGKR